MRTEKAAILFNPSAGKGRALKKKDELEQLLREYDIPFDLFVTQSEENLRELTRENISRYTIIAGAGGDSTFHIMINEITRTEADVTFGMIGIGSSNDIAREFGADSLEKACLALKRGQARRVDIGCISQEDKVIGYFLGQANIGLGVLVNKYVAELSQKKTRPGRAQTLAGVLGVIRSYISGKVPVPLTVESDRGTAEGLFMLAIFSNIRYWATGRTLCPNALPHDGRLDGCLIRTCAFLRLAHLALLAKKGKHIKAKEVEASQSHSFRVSSEQAFEIQADGEIVGGGAKPASYKKIEFRVIPRALNIII